MLLIAACKNQPLHTWIISMETIDSRSDSGHHCEIKSVMQNIRWNASNAKAYNRYRMISRRQSWMKLLREELSCVPAGESILEVGAGTGFITGILAGSGYNVVATDLSPSMLAVAARNIAADGSAERVRFLERDAESLATEDNAFDAVVSRWVLWTLPRPRMALAEMARTLAPGGRFVLIDGQHREVDKWARCRASLVDFFLAGRMPGWHPKEFTDVKRILPRLDAPEVVSILDELGLEKITSRKLSDREGDGFLRNWLMGHAWESYMVTAFKPR